MWLISHIIPITMPTRKTITPIAAIINPQVHAHSGPKFGASMFYIYLRWDFH
jgi:hypothetical protein